MARVKGAMMTRKRRKKILKLAKGYFGSKSRHFKMAKQAVYKSGKKEEEKRIWIKYFGNLKGRNPLILLTFAAFLSIILFCKVSS